MLVAKQASNQERPAMKRSIKKVAVLGSGVMGSRIACHFANIGVEVLLLDIPPRELTPKETAKGLSLDHPAVRNRLVNEYLQAAIKGQPSPLFTKGDARYISTGNFEDDFEKISDCDLVLEAVVERLDIKQQILEKVDQLRKPGSIIASNTSGIPIQLMAKGRSEDFRKHFLGMHFFNPPRYLRLLEIIPGPDTDAGLIGFLMHYGDVFLGKQTVLCKDTPAFIANRVGVFTMATMFRLIDDIGLTIEEVDKITGPASGKPKSGTFRLSDLVGLDTTVHVINGIKANCPDDEVAQAFEIPAYVNKMLENKWLGDKTGQGFYKKTRDEQGNRLILALDLNTLEYRPQEKVRIPSLGEARNISDLGERMRLFFKANDKAGELVRRSHLALFAYVSHRIPEIADELYQIDDAIRAGFGWDKGPFELWDMVGVKEGLKQLEAEGLEAADWVHQMVKAGHDSFYQIEGGKKTFYSHASHSFQPVPGTDSLILLDTLRDTNTVWSSNDCALIDLGDGVLNVEFRSKMNTLGDGVVKGINKALDLAENEGWNGVVIGNEAPDFSLGANLMLISMLAMEQEWDELNMAISYFQKTAMRLRTCAVPVVSAPQGRVLGGGCEYSMHSDRIVASAETYIGLVEVGVGLIPAGGGTKELTLRAADQYTQPGGIAVATLQKYLMNIATAKVATSAEEAREMDILSAKDKVVMNLSRRLKEAKDTVLELVEEGYTPPVERKDIKVMGRNALSSFYAAIAGMHFGHYATAHDVKIAKKIAYVMAGGDLSGEALVSETYLLDLEREAFLSLLGERKTLERIQHTLKTGKPLRN